MVVDERINNIRESIFKKGIIYAILTAVCLIACKAILILISKQFEIEKLIFEAVIILSGFGVLILSMLYKEGNPYYYKQSAEYFLGISLLGFAIYVVLSLNMVIDSYISLFSELFLFESLCLFYFIYQYKKNDIYCNNEIISKENQVYYKAVIKNIIKLLLLSAISFSLAFVVGIAIYVDSGFLVGILYIILTFIITTVSIIAIYLFISIIEKVSYKEENEKQVFKGKYSKATLIVGIFYTLLIVFYFLKSIILIYISEVADLLEINFSEVISFFSYLLSQCNYLSYALFACLVSYLLVQTRHNRNVVNGIKVVIITTVLTYFIYYVSSFLFYLELKINFSLPLRYIGSFLSFIVYSTKILGILYILIHLAYEMKFDTVVIVIPITNLIIAFITFIFTISNKGYKLNDFFNYITMLINVCYVILFAVVKNNKKRIEKFESTLEE